MHPKAHRRQKDRATTFGKAQLGELPSGGLGPSLAYPPTGGITSRQIARTFKNFLFTSKLLSTN
jgi:hypothetical protein